MPAKNEDLHGSVPDKAEVALLLSDVINDLEFDDGENDYTLEKLRRLLDADIRPSTALDFAELKQRAAREPESNPEPQSRKFAGEN